MDILLKYDILIDIQEYMKVVINLKRRKQKINHLMYIGYKKIFAKNEKELETFIQTIKV